MSFPLDWDGTRENGLRIINSPISPINGASSLLLFSDGSEWNATNIGVRKSASLFLRNGVHERGFAEGRITTLIRRNVSTPQSNAWGGIYVVSDTEGIGLVASQGQNRYEITDRGDGFIKLIKYTVTFPTTLATSAISFSPGTVYGLQVRWKFNGITNALEFRISLGTALSFSDLSEIIVFTDSSPHTNAVTEGLFVQTLSNDDLVSYTFDTTSVFRLIHL